MNKKDLTQKEIEYKIQIYCSYQERCHSEVYKKLKEFKIKEQMINEILSNLITQNFLNESRFSKLFSKSKFNIKNWGRIRIINELRKEIFHHTILNLASRKLMNLIIKKLD